MKDKEKSKKKRITIIVQTKPVEVEVKKLSYWEIVKLAFPNADPTNQNIYFRVMYDNGPKQNPEGYLSEGEKVKLAEDMTFNVRTGNKS